MNLETVLSLPEVKPVKKNALKWTDWLENRVNFYMKDSRLHTVEHCIRVLIYSLILAEKLNLSEDETEILALCAVFHDTRRFSDKYDTGHGKRAAEYYKEYCEENGLNFRPEVYAIMKYHDRNDELGVEKIKENPSLNERTVLLYKAFKDADALDRFRLGKNGLDAKRLRNKEALGMYDLAEEIWEKYSNNQKAH